MNLYLRCDLIISDMVIIIEDPVISPGPKDILRSSASLPEMDVFICAQIMKIHTAHIGIIRYVVIECLPYAFLIIRRADDTV